MDKKLHEIDQKVARLQRELNRAKSQKKDRQRTIDTRRKILLGALLSKLLNEHEFGDDFREVIKAKLDSYLTKDSDRALFADLLPPVEPDKPQLDDAEIEAIAFAEKQTKGIKVANVDGKETSEKSTAKTTTTRKTRQKKTLNSSGDQNEILKEFDL